VQPPPFDLCGPLPRGVTVLEASAGTGKTHTIAALATRYLAEGVPIERLLLVTFTRIATGELRERVRERLVTVRLGLERALARAAAPSALTARRAARPMTGPPSPGSASSADPIVALLLADGREQAELRLARLARALADFDAATITTTHGFCQEVLASLGVAADLEPDAVFVDDLSGLADEVIADLYVRRFYRGVADPDRSKLPFAKAATIGRAAILHADAALVQASHEPQAMRVRLADVVRRELERRKRELGVITYDDLLSRLELALAGEEGELAAARLRARFEVVLVDEFQDTDRVQWSILRRAFASPERALILIADPKQAIYAFRGADVYSYLEAARSAHKRATLAINWRADQGLLDAYDQLFGGARLGHEEIEYRRVRSAPAHRAPRLLGAPIAVPLRVRLVAREDVGLTPRGYAAALPAREHVVADLAQEIVALLASGAVIERRDPQGQPLAHVPLAPEHVAVLVATNRQAELVRERLSQAGVPAVTNGTGSVFASDAAKHWLTLLEALEQPSLRATADRAAIGHFLGWSAERLALASDSERERLHRRLHELARVLRTAGVASLLESITRSELLPERLLSIAGGERALTDLRHIGELLHAEANARRLGMSALVRWLRRRIAEADVDVRSEERSRRLESDAAAVQVLTIHRSKGLEFPIVHLPFAWEPTRLVESGDPVVFHDPDAGERRALDVSLTGRDYAAHYRQHVREERGEDLRLLYVALTRASQQAVLWWAGSRDSRHSALGRLLFCRDERGNVAASGDRDIGDAEVRARFEELAAARPGAISVERSRLGPPPAYAPQAAAPPELSAARFERTLDLGWRRTSYSDLVRGAHEPTVASEPEEPLLADEPDAEPGLGPPLHEPPPAGSGPLSQQVPLAALGMGSAVGTFVHQVLERCDFAAADLDSELDRACAQLGPKPDGTASPEVLREGLRAAIETPLGPLAGEAALRHIGPSRRLDELAFELPLAGGEQPTGWVTLERLAAVLEARLAPSDPLAGYAERLRDPSLRARIRGYLAGSLDLVARLPDGRFAVIDYKTNWLGEPDGTLTAWHHRPAALAAEMSRRHYGLQAVLYAVALHRFLRWRRRGCDPDEELAGVFYLFVRGMLGPATPLIDGQRCGIFAWRPPPGLIGALSQALEGEP